jgi:subtilisin family serine protease
MGLRGSPIRRFLAPIGMLFDLIDPGQGGTLKKLVNLAAIIVFLFAYASVVSASEKTLLFKVGYLDRPLQNSSFLGNKRLGHAGVVENLMAASTASQSDFIGALEDDVKITGFETYWIANIIKVTGDSAELERLAQRHDIEDVFEDWPVELIAPVEIHEHAIAEVGHTAGLEAIKAPQAWALGLNGSGSLVCNFDTGVDGDHVALSSKYRGNNSGEPGACWFDPYSHTEFPSDNNGHGTHTMGTMIGADSSDTVGVAPGAQWIAAGVVDRGGGIQQTISDILAAFQWAADPDGDPSTCDDVPDVVNNSWGIPMGYYPSCETTFWEAIDNLEAAGVVCIFAAGNEGPNPGTMRIPADRISSEFNTFSVGAVDAGDPGFPVAGFSSRGPSGCDNQTIKPEVTAPGVGIRSTSRTGGYVLMSGTSMAAPHVAGAVAILRQFNPQATPDEIKRALMNSAQDLGQPGEDNDYGWGMIDIRRALDFMPAPENPFPVIVSTDILGDGLALPGVNFHLSIALANLGSAASNVDAHLSASDPQAEVLSGDLSFGPLSESDTIEIDGWDIRFSNELIYGQHVVFDLDLTFDGLTAHRYFMIPVGDQNTSVIEEPAPPGSPSFITNYPNPFNSSTIIRIGDAAENAILSIYDTSGRLVAMLRAKNGQAIWNAAGFPSGLYFARAEGDKRIKKSIKLILLK